MSDKDKKSTDQHKKADYSERRMVERRRQLKEGRDFWRELFCLHIWVPGGKTIQFITTNDFDKYTLGLPHNLPYVNFVDY